MTRARIVLAGILAFVCSASMSAAFGPWAPPQPPSGPGGSDYPWAQVTTTRYVNANNNDLTYWIIAPRQWQGTGTAPTQLPLVVFLHGWGAADPGSYQTWLNHIARKGRIVVFPAYQSLATPWLFFTPNAIAATQAGLAQIAAGSAGANGLRIDPTAGMHLIGHSFGGSTAINMAARYANNRLPEPKAIVLSQPYNMAIDADLSAIPPTTLLDCIVSAADTIAGRSGCDRVWDGTAHIPAANRNYIWMNSDQHGMLPLIADHFVPVVTTALDFYGPWKLADALVDCAVYGHDCAFALGGSGLQTGMGNWSDGVAVRPLSITTSKPTCPAGSTAAGC